jgi:cobalt/nickel transport system permease protein
MAFVMPFAGYYIYRLLAGKSELLSRRSLVGIFSGGYAGINAAAFFTALELGIQPLLFKTAEGSPLYGFYPLSVSIPVVMGEHLLVAGFVEGLVTEAAVTYVAKSSPQFITRSRDLTEGNTSENNNRNKGYGRLIRAIILLAVLTPLGLIATGTAFGEWGTEEIKGRLGYIPAGLEKLSRIWKSLFPGYSLPGKENGFFSSAAGYVVSAFIGILAVALLLFISGRLMGKGGKEEE